VPGLFLNSFSYLDLYCQEKKMENPGKKNWKAHHSVVMLKKHFLQNICSARNNIPILVTPMCKTDVMKETQPKRILDQIANMYPWDYTEAEHK
jgi:hypothetical protein